MNEDEGKIIKPSGENKDKEQKKESDEIIVSVHFNTKTGGVGVKGPGNGNMYDEPMCLWLFDKGKDFVKGYNAMKTRPKIVQPGASFGVPGLKMKPRPG